METRKFGKLVRLSYTMGELKSVIFYQLNDIQLNKAEMMEKLTEFQQPLRILSYIQRRNRPFSRLRNFCR